MSAPNASYYAQLAREAVADAKAKWQADHAPAPLPETADTTDAEESA